MADTTQPRLPCHGGARLLGRDSARLAYLERLPPDDLHLLRDGATEALYDAHGGALERLPVLDQAFSG
jgi:hypothetical protein